MSDAVVAADASKATPFAGGQKLMMIAGVLGVVGLVTTGIGFVIDPARTAPSYLLAFVYWVGIAIATLIMLAIFHAAGATWMTVLRRQMEHHAFAVVLGLVFVIPIIVFRKYLFLWANDELVAKLPEHSQHLLHHKAPYLNVPFFAGRAFGFIAFWAVLAFVMSKLSLEQDSKPADMAIRTRLLRMSSVALPFLGLTITFAGFDWLMSLEPEWPSTMFGVWYFAGSFLAAFAVLTLTTVLPMDKVTHGAFTKGTHLHNLGKLLLAFTAFWAYISFSQLIIIWHANIPEEASWYFARGFQGVSRWSEATVNNVSPNPTGDTWFPLTMFLFVGGFVLPFLALLSQRLKYNRKYMAVVSLWILFVHFLDQYWAILPAMRLVNANLTTPSPSWQDLTAFIGVGGISVAFVIFRMRGKHTIPVNDPALPKSLAYEQPLGAVDM